VSRPITITTQSGRKIAALRRYKTCASKHR